MSAEILEEGRVYFFYRPRVGQAEVDDVEEVQRLHIVLRPRGTDRFRNLVIGRERLPRVEEAHGGMWATVVDVVEGADRLREALGPCMYDTKTRGRRHVPAARLAGEGVYVLARHGDHTHLAYARLHPQQPGEVQRELNLQRQANYIITVRNAHVSPPPGTRAGADRRPQFPDDLQARFGDRRFAPVDPPDFLAHEGAEVALIGAAGGDPARELGINLDSEAEQLGVREVFEELRLSRDRQLADPLEKGELDQAACRHAAPPVPPRRHTPRRHRPSAPRSSATCGNMNRCGATTAGSTGTRHARRHAEGGGPRRWANGRFALREVPD